MPPRAPTSAMFSGSCHCGFVRYEAALPVPSPPGGYVASRCNCTICLKSGFTSLRLAPDHFVLRSPESLDELSDYQPNSKKIHKYFCKTCGIHVVGRGEYEFEGKVEKFFTLNILTLDQPQEGLDLRDWRMEYWDGRNNNWQGGKKMFPWPGGVH